MEPLADSGDDTASFECREAASSPGPGTPPTHTWSEHAYGEAVDVNPIENPYTGCGHTHDKASIPYLNRSHHRPGMVTAAVVEAFASVAGAQLERHQGLHALLRDRPLTLTPAVPGPNHKQ